MLRWLLALMMAVFLTGGHVALLQVVAWSEMLIVRSQQQGWSGAVSSTFDGRHPCSMCMAIQSLKQSENRVDAATPTKGDPAGLAKQVKKSDLVPPCARFSGEQAILGEALTFASTPALPAGMKLEPELPPPRV